MAIRVSPPYKFFTDTTGDPLEGGKIYIGTSGLDPEANPITAYFDDAETIIAAQPIRTIAGIPVNTGSPADIYVPTSYSITIRDTNDILIYTKLINLATDDSPMTPYMQGVNQSVDSAEALTALNAQEASAALDAVSGTNTGDNVQATDAIVGITRYATLAEEVAGASETVAVTAAGVARMALAGVEGVMIKGITSLESTTNHSKTVTTGDPVSSTGFSTSLSITPTNGNTKLIIFMDFLYEIEQSGGDNDARGQVTIASFEDNPDPGPSNLTITHGFRQIGIRNGGTNPRVHDSSVQFIILEQANLDDSGDWSVQAYGTPNANAFAGQSHTLTSDSTNFLAIEYQEGGSSSSIPPTFRYVAGTTDTILPADFGNYVVYQNAGAVTVTVDDSTGVGADIGRSVIIVQNGAGIPTVSTGGSAVLETPTGFNPAVAAVNGQILLTKRTADDYLVGGSLGAV